MCLCDLFLLQQFSQFIWCNCSTTTKSNSNICVYYLHPHGVSYTWCWFSGYFRHTSTLPHFHTCVRCCVLFVSVFVLFLFVLWNFLINVSEWNVTLHAKRQAPNAFEWCVMCVCMHCAGAFCCLFFFFFVILYLLVISLFIYLLVRYWWQCKWPVIFTHTFPLRLHFDFQLFAFQLLFG